MAEINRAQIEEAVRLILEAIGEDPHREGLLDTPKRVAKMYEEVWLSVNCGGANISNTLSLEGM